MKYPYIVLEELKRFDEKVLAEDLIGFINIAIKYKLKVYIEYD